jgi:hypothetical protein
VERLEDRECPAAGIDPIANVLGGAALLDSLSGAPAAFQAGQSTMQSALKVLPKNNPVAHVLVDAALVTGTVVGSQQIFFGASLAAARAALVSSLQALIAAPGGTGTLTAGLGPVIKGVAFATGAASVVIQDLVANGPNAASQLRAFGIQATPAINSGINAAVTAVASTVTSLLSFPGYTINQAIADFQRTFPPPIPLLLVPPSTGSSGSFLGGSTGGSQTGGTLVP